ncbi:MAG: lipid A biosynthesis acyltransferase [Betaproteobacteria bacterium]|nr:lipid A biosynthesis acyltransferase [Betaproteobacteria bacterium]
MSERHIQTWIGRWGAQAAMVLLWALHLLPLPLLAALGRSLGRLLHVLAHSRRRVALRNVQRCLPELTAPQQQALVREHFEYLGRSLLERGVLWWASPDRLRRLIEVQGDVGLAERSSTRFMWVVPHFLALEVAGVATQLFQDRAVTAFYQQQSNAVFDEAIRRGRIRFGKVTVHTRHDNALKLMRDLRQGAAFLNLPDMDFGLKDAAFVPFFGIEAATLLAPARMARSLDMMVQPVLALMRPDGRGYIVKFLPPWTHWPGAEDDVSATRQLNAWIEEQVMAHPAQYLWVHKRFKTRPEGQAPFYD